MNALGRGLARAATIHSQYTLGGGVSRVLLSSCSPGDDASVEWRKKQLDKLEKKFQDTVIENEEDLQPMWKNLETRVKHRRPRTHEESGGKSGRTNRRRTDEDVWLEEGLYSHDEKTER